MPGFRTRRPARAPRRLFTFMAGAVLVAAAAIGSTPARAAGVIAPGLAFQSLAVTATEGVQFEGDVIHATVSQPDAPTVINRGGLFSATIDWGDESSSPGALGLIDGGFAVGGTHTWHEHGSYTVTVHIFFGGGQQETIAPIEIGSGTSEATVADAALSAESCSAVPSVAFSGESVHFYGEFIDANTFATLDDMTATLLPGDGREAVDATVTKPGNEPMFSASADVTYTDPGSYEAVLTLNDKGGQSAFCTIDVTIEPYPLTVNAISAVEGTEWSGVVGTFTPQVVESVKTPVNGGSFSYSIDWGDGTDKTTGDSFAGGDISGTHTYVEEGKYTITVNVMPNELPRVKDGRSEGFTRTAIATVADAALTATGVDNSAAVGALFTGTVAKFTDANPMTALEDFTEVPGGAKIDWGDGSTPTAGTIHVLSGGGYSVEGSHSYAAAGKYTVTTLITDFGGAQATAKSFMTVGGSTVPTGTTQALVSTPNTGASSGGSGPAIPGVLLVLLGLGLVVAARRTRGHRYPMV